MASDAIGLCEMRVWSNAWIKRLALDLEYPKKASTWVSGEQARVQADQGDPFGLLWGEAKRAQQFFPSLQVRKLHRFVGSADPKQGHQDSHGIPQGEMRGFSGELRFTTK